MSFIVAADEQFRISWGGKSVLKRVEGCNYTAPTFEVLRPDGTSMQPHERAAARAMSENRVIRDVEMGFERPDGITAWINVSAAPLEDEAGGLTGVVDSFADVSQP